MAVIGLGIVLWKLPNPQQKELQQDDALPESNEQVNKSSAIARVDLLGAAALVSTVLTGLLCLDQAAGGASNYVLIAGFATAFVASSLVFYFVESRWAKEPILPLDLVLKRDVLTSYSIICLQAAGQFGVSGILSRLHSSISHLWFWKNVSLRELANFSFARSYTPSRSIFR